MMQSLHILKYCRRSDDPTFPRSVARQMECRRQIALRNRFGREKATTHDGASARALASHGRPFASHLDMLSPPCPKSIRSRSEDQTQVVPSACNVHCTKLALSLRNLIEATKLMKTARVHCIPLRFCDVRPALLPSASQPEGVPSTCS